MNCDDVRRGLAEREQSGAIDRHLAACAGCRTESGRLERLLRIVGSGREVELPHGLDLAVKALLLGPVRRARPFSRPAMAAGLATAACLAVASALAIVAAEAGAAEWGPFVAVGVLTAYLAASSAVALPLLLVGRRRLATLGGAHR